MTQSVLERPLQQSIVERRDTRATIGAVRPEAKRLPPLTLDTIELDDLVTVPDVVW